MILTPIDLDRLPATLADFTAALQRDGQGLALRVLARIADSLALVEGTDISLSQHPDHHRQALELLARFGIAKLVAAPTILILSPAGELLNGDDLVALQDARSMTPQAVVDWLAHWAA